MTIDLKIKDKSIKIKVIALLAQDSPRTRESFNLGWKFVKYFNASGEAVATDNGDAAIHELFQAKSKKAYNGLCLVIGPPLGGFGGKKQ